MGLLLSVLSLWVLGSVFRAAVVRAVWSSKIPLANTPSAGLHAAEASYVSSSSISAFRAAIVRAVWSSKTPLANAPAILNLLDGPVGVDPAFHVVRSRFRIMRRYLAYNPDEEPRIFRMLYFTSRGAEGHGPVHILLISAAELGSAWDGAEQGWVRVSLPPLRMMTGPVQHFRSAILDAWRFSVFSGLSERKGFLGGEFADFQGSLQLLTSSHLRERDKNVVKSHFMWWSLERIPSWKAKKEDVPCRFFGKKMVMDIYFGNVPFHLPSLSPCLLSLLLHVRELPAFPLLWPLIEVIGLAVCYGMAGCLGLLVLVEGPWATSFWQCACCELERRLGALFVLRLILGMLMILLWRCLMHLIFGRWCWCFCSCS